MLRSGGVSSYGPTSVKLNDCSHYEDCWNELARMFGSTQTLPPRTKRWAEAKVLADCVAMRVSPSNDHSPRLIKGRRYAGSISMKGKFRKSLDHSLSISSVSVTCREDGVSAKKRLSFGAGLRGSMSLVPCLSTSYL